jgi:hypothetical protein
MKGVTDKLALYVHKTMAFKTVRDALISPFIRNEFRSSRAPATSKDG